MIIDLQFGHMLSFWLTTKPQLGQVVGCTSPSGAPQARQRLAPVSLAVWQYGQTMRANRAERAWPVPC